MPKYLLAHDLGTSGNKATLYDDKGQLVRSITRHYELMVKNQNWAEQRPDDWWQAVCSTTRELTAEIEKADIAAVSFSGQMMGCVCVDKNGNALRNAIIWADMRAVEEENAVRAQIDDKRFYRITGHRLNSSYGGFKLMWVKNHEPELYDRTYKMLNAKDYIILRLTGKFVTEYSDASSTCLFDINKMSWSDEILSAAKIEKSKLPDILYSTDIAGAVHAEAAKATGLLAGTPVVCGGGDGSCAAVGSGCVREGIANSCMGTSSWISVTTRKPIIDEAMNTVTWPHIIPGYMMPCGAMQSGGGAFNWAVKTILGEESDSNFLLANQKIAASPIGAKNLLFLPYLIGERSPRWNPECKGAFIGLTLEHDAGDMLRAVMEGVAYNLNIVLDTFKNNGCDIKQIIMIGGGARSAIWRQIFADVYRTAIIKPNYLNEATSMGAALTGGVGVGLFDNFDAVEKFLYEEERNEPIESNSVQYDKFKPLFDDSYYALQTMFSRLSHANE